MVVVEDSRIVGFLLTRIFSVSIPKQPTRGPYTERDSVSDRSRYTTRLTN